jgi:magnesium transporter
MQPTGKATEMRPVEQTPRAADKDSLRDALREQGDRGQTKFDIVLLSVQRLLRRGAITNLAKMLGRMHPADVAKVVTHLSSPKEKREVFELVRGETKRGQVLSELDSESITQVLADLLQSDIAWLIKDLAPDDVAYILGVLPEERAKEILSLMRTEDSTEVAGLLKYPKDTAGGIMTTEFFSMSEDATAQDAIRRLQQASDAEMVFYIYVTDKNEHLVGVLSLRQLLTVPPATPLKNIATREVISVSAEMDQEEVARQVASYNLLAIPVVDKTGILVGIITVDDVVDVIREEATEDMLKMAGAVEQEAVSKSSSVAAAKVRLPWLFTNLVGSLLSGAILWEFRYTIQEVVAIVSFIPVIAAMGGNVGLQSSTLIIRGLATGLVELTDVWTIFFREVKIGLLMGVACGIILTVVGWIWHQGFLGMVVGASLITAFLVSTSMATFMPIFLKRMGVDPAVAAGPFVTTANDITGITIYLTLATVFMEYLR